ncbi:MAG TPA: hypothetical protein VMF52_11150 [Steroidobacteraceae bacterium]|nr:hypothetical protein [Steroidobacteraceae bacterium]
MKTARLLMWTCIALFAARVIGQFETLILAPAWLPEMDAWYSGLLPYPLLLPAQIAILMLMAAVAWNRRIRNGAFARANPRVAGALRIFAGLYFVVMAVRLGVNLNDNGADFWREGAIPVAFHWVLALFVLVAARSSAAALGAVPLPAADPEDDIPHGDVALLPQPLADELGLAR